MFVQVPGTCFERVQATRNHCHPNHGLVVIIYHLIVDPRSISFLVVDWFAWAFHRSIDPEDPQEFIFAQGRARIA